MPEPSGLLCVDKPAGMTSHDVCARVRRVLSTRKVGHAGTLDPGATGVLLVGVGSVTRLLRFLSVLEKAYTCEIVFGTSTDTLDDSGTTTGTFAMGPFGADALEAAVAGLTGDILQRPPMVSAVKIDGRRLHELAREGLEVERPARPVRVSRFELTPTDDPLVWVAGVECSSGTYVRVLADDLGRALGGGAHLRHLRRTSIGTFGLDVARPLDEIGTEDLLPPSSAVAHLGRVVIDADQHRRLSTGRPFAATEVELPGGAGPWGVFDEAGTLLAVYDGTDPIKPVVVLDAR